MSPSDLVARYRSLPFPSSHLGDSQENYLKCQILSGLESSANDPDVSQLLLDILSTRDEFDLLRMDAARIVGEQIDHRSPLERTLLGQIWQIVADRSEDPMLRQHAPSSLVGGFGGEGELSLVDRVLFDDAEDLDVRHGVLNFLARADARLHARALLPRLLEHEYWSQCQTALAKIIRSLDADSEAK